MFAETERLRRQLEIERTQHSVARTKAMKQGQSDSSYFEWGRIAEYRRGRSDGVRLALEIIAQIAREEAQDGKNKKG